MHSEKHRICFVDESSAIHTDVYVSAWRQTHCLHVMQRFCHFGNIRASYVFVLVTVRRCLLPETRTYFPMSSYDALLRFERMMLLGVGDGLQTLVRYDSPMRAFRNWFRCAPLSAWYACL